MADRILLPGERAVFLKSDNKLSISTVHPENTISWVTGIFKFKDSSLADIMQELQRAFHVKIHIQNENLKNRLSMPTSQRKRHWKKYYQFCKSQPDTK